MEFTKKDVKLYNVAKTFKEMFAEKNIEIAAEYYVMMAEYLVAMEEVKDSLKIDPLDIMARLPDKLENIRDIDLGGIYGMTDSENVITMNSRLNDKTKQLYFFHELTHILHDGNLGMFLEEATTQYTAEILYRISNNLPTNIKEQKGVVRGQPDRIVHSYLNEYQYNGSVLLLLSRTLNISIPELLTLAYKPNGREVLKEHYESLEGKKDKFEDFMMDLEKIYVIDKVIIGGGKNLELLKGDGVLVNYQGQKFKISYGIQKQLMDQVESDLFRDCLRNNDKEYILSNYNDILNSLTTEELQNEFQREFEGLERGQSLRENPFIVNANKDNSLENEYEVKRKRRDNLRKTLVTSYKAEDKDEFER